MRKIFVISLAAAVLACAACKKDEPVVYNGDGGITPVPEAVDLGIYADKKGGGDYCVKWASFNLGASSEEQSGDYLAWGEITPKHNYSWDTYKWATDDQKLTKYCSNQDSWTGKSKKCDKKTRLDPGDDAATVRLGGKWRMPTKLEMEGLLATKSDTEHYSWEYQTISGMKGWRITWLETGANIFIPQACNYEGAAFNPYFPQSGSYWTSDLDNDIMANFAFFNEKNPPYIISHERIEGMTIRPVYVE